MLRCCHQHQHSFGLKRIQLTLSTAVGIRHGLCQHHRVVDAAFGVDSQMGENVIKDLLLHKGENKDTMTK